MSPLFGRKNSPEEVARQIATEIANEEVSLLKLTEEMMLPYILPTRYYLDRLREANVKLDPQKSLKILSEVMEDMKVRT